MDGGQSGNLFAGHYFDFNRKHLDGTLREAIIGKASVEMRKHSKMFIKPASEKKGDQKKDEI